MHQDRVKLVKILPFLEKPLLYGIKAMVHIDKMCTKGVKHPDKGKLHLIVSIVDRRIDKTDPLFAPDNIATPDIPVQQGGSGFEKQRLKPPGKPVDTLNHSGIKAPLFMATSCHRKNTVIAVKSDP